MERKKKKKPVRHLELTAYGLRCACFVLTVIGTLGAVVIPNAVLHLDVWNQADFLEQIQNGGIMFASGAAIVCMFIGKMALPLAALLTQEGYVKTSSKRKYLLRLLVCALVSEPVYDFAMTGTWFDMRVQSPILGLAIILVTLWLMDYMGRSAKGLISASLGRMVVMLAGCAWAWMLNCGALPTTVNVYRGLPVGATMVLLAAMTHLFQGKRLPSTIIGCGLTLLDFPAPLSYTLRHFYEGQKGRPVGLMFYILYPAHLLILGVLSRCF